MEYVKAEGGRWSVGEPEIQGYRFGAMTVNGERHSKDLIVLPDRVVANWWREKGHRLEVEDLWEVLDATPEVLVVGTGAYGMMDVPEKTRQAIEAANIELRIAQTGDAWQLYNDLQKQRRTAGAFHLTC
jgi:hypothetical protein